MKRRPEQRVEGIEGARKRGLRELVRGTRGAVMGEAVIMLPVLILIWSIILYIHFGFRDAQRNQVTLREQAWTHAYGGCNSDATDGSTNIDDGGQFDGESDSGAGGLASVGLLEPVYRGGGRIEIRSLGRPDHVVGKANC